MHQQTWPNQNHQFLPKEEEEEEEDEEEEEEEEEEEMRGKRTYYLYTVLFSSRNTLPGLRSR